MRPVRIVGEGGRVTALEGVRVTWKTPGQWSGRNALDVPGSAVLMPADSVVVAIGQCPDEGLLRCIAGVKTSSNGCVVVNPETGLTSQPGIFAAGDILAGSYRRTVVQSVAEGKAAAQAIHSYLHRSRSGEA